MEKKKQKQSFEDAIEELENVVEQLEKGELTLEESIDFFQKGIELSKYCGKKLDEIEKKISVLIDNGQSEVSEEILPDLDGGRSGIPE